MHPKLDLLVAGPAFRGAFLVSKESGEVYTGEEQGERRKAEGEKQSYRDLSY